jgi:hypothetical protein
MTEPVVVNRKAEEDDEDVSREAAVTISWNGAVIQGVTVIGRPAHPYSGGEGNHTTAWAVLVDTVRRAVVGAGANHAITAMESLVRLLRVDGKADMLNGPRRKAYEAAITRARAALKATSKKGVRAQTVRASLQEAVRAYLTARNLAPLASAFLGGGQATGAGERRPLAVLRDFEETSNPAVPGEELCEAIWALLDTRTIGFVIDLAAPDAIPGLAGTTGAERAAAAREILRRHLMEISRAYPRAYYHSGLTSIGVVRSTAPADAQGSAGALTKTDLPKVKSGMPAAPAGWAGWGSGVAVSFDLTTNIPPKATNVIIGQRGRTLLGTQGHHLTAHVAFERGVRKAIENHDLTTVSINLLKLAEDLVALPTCPQRKEGPPRPSSHEDPKGIFTPVWLEFKGAYDAVKTGTSRVSEQERLQDLATAYLALRNALPWTAILHGGPANNKNESWAAATLDQYEADLDNADANEACGALWGLLDLDNLAEVYQDTHVHGPLRDPDQRLRALLYVHYQTVAAAWPQCYARSEFASVSSIRYGLGRMQMTDVDSLTDRMCKALGITNVGKVEPTYHYERTDAKLDPTETYEGEVPPREKTDERRSTKKTTRFGEFVSDSQVSSMDFDSQSEGSESQYSQPNPPYSMEHYANQAKNEAKKQRT